MTGFGRAAITLGFLTLLGAPAMADGADEIAITNLNYGPLCSDTEAKFCGQNSDIVLDNKGKCVFNGQEVACTWYGYSFDYTLTVPKVDLDCTWTSNLPVMEGNPDGIRTASGRSGNFKITLTNDQTSFVNPEYSAGLVVASTTTQTCSYKGRKLFEITFNLKPPA